MIRLSTSDPHAQGRLLFCLIGRVVDARVGHEIITLTYADGRTAEFATSGVAFTFGESADYPEPSSVDR